MPSRITRRAFLQAAVAIGGLMLAPSIAGYNLYQAAQGEFPPTLSPYADDPVALSDSVRPMPILLLVNERSSNPFGKYCSEILRAEGLNCFRAAMLSSLTPALLDVHDVVLLTEGQINSTQVEMLESFVSHGGSLVAMRPDERLARIFGVERLTGTTTSGYIQTDPEHPFTQGVVTESLQFHGNADHYRLAGAQAIAWLSPSAQVEKKMPAITWYQYGRGQTAMWAFDLVQNIVLMRQGDPALTDTSSPGWEGSRTVNLFRGWIDLNRLAIPQADELQRLFANVLTALSLNKRPLPRLWYFPGTAPSMLIATSDSHGNSAAALEDMIERIERRKGHVSVYYLAYPETDARRTLKRGVLEATRLPFLGEAFAHCIKAPSPAHIANWRSRGHEFAMHPAVDNNGIFDDLELNWRIHWQEFTGMGYGPVPKTVRTHRVAWRGWIETARLQASYGMRMNMDFYHWGPLFRNANKEWLFGYLTGSGLPMLFVDEQGRLLNIYQQLTELADDHMLDLHWGGWAKLPPDQALEVSGWLLRQSVARYPSAIVNHVHTDPFDVGGESASRAGRYLEGTLDTATELGIPIWSAEEWLGFTQVRHDANMTVEWDADVNRLNIQLSSRSAPNVQLTMLIPATYGQLKLSSVHVDNQTVPFSEWRVGGVRYGRFMVGSGGHRVVASFQS